MSTPSSTNFLFSATRAISLSRQLDAPGLRASLVERACAQLAGEDAEAAGIVFASGSMDSDYMHALGREAWAAARGQAVYPFDIKPVDDASRAAMWDARSDLITVVKGLGDDWKPKLATLLDGLRTEIAARAGKTLASPETAQRVAQARGAADPALADALGPDEIVVFENEHSVDVESMFSPRVPGEFSIGVIDQKSLAAWVGAKASTSATLDVAAKLRAKAVQEACSAVPGGPKA